MPNELLTIGHSTHPMENFIKLLSDNSVEAIVDVRSSPYSRMNPQFNREPLQKYLIANRIDYVFMGKELGARSDNPACYVDGRVIYDFIAQTEIFKEGIAKVRDAAQSCRIALLCAEKDPIQCHRMILVCRYLRGPDVTIKHILADGALELNTQAEQRLMAALNMSEEDLFENESRRIEKAYDKQAEKIAYRFVENPIDADEKL